MEIAFITAWIWKALGGWRGVIMSALLAFSVGTAAYYVREYDRRGTELATLELKNSALTNQINVQKANNRLIEAGLNTLNRELLRRDKDIEDACKLLKEIDKDNTPGADDQVHGTIGKALDALKD